VRSNHGVVSFYNVAMPDLSAIRLVKTDGRKLFLALSNT